MVWDPWIVKVWPTTKSTVVVALSDRVSCYFYWDKWCSVLPFLSTENHFMQFYYDKCTSLLGESFYPYLLG